MFSTTFPFSLTPRHSLNTCIAKVGAKHQSINLFRFGFLKVEGTIVVVW